MCPGTVTEFDSWNPYILDQSILIINRTIIHELISVYSSKKGLDQTHTASLVLRTNKFVPWSYGHLTEKIRRAFGSHRGITKRLEEHLNPMVLLLKESKNTHYSISPSKTHTNSRIEKQQQQSQKKITNLSEIIVI